jgi:UDP-glucose 4-epimerase
MSFPVVIFGSSGFIGRKLTRAIESIYEEVGQVLVVSRVFFDCPSETEINSLSKKIDRQSTMVIASGVKKQNGDNLESFGTNIDIAKVICKLIAISPPQRVIFISSAAVYGGEFRDEVICEKSIPRPDSYYGAAKYCSELIIEKTCREFDVNSYIFLRPPLVYGLGDTSLSYGPLGMLHEATTDKTITLWGDGEELREFVYIDDFCEVVLCLLESHYQGPLNVVTGASLSFRSIADEIVFRYPPVKLFFSRRTKAQFDAHFDNKKLREVLGTEIKFTSIKEGLKRMIERG